MQTLRIAPDYDISRIIRGGWQMASGHGSLPSADPLGDMAAYADAGITTFDCADIYTGVEELIGAFRAHYRNLRGEAALARLHVHTKYVPDLTILRTLTKADVEAVVDQSLKRLRTERLDLVQFHWWDYDEPRWLDTAGWLAELKRAGKIRNIGATNFEADRLEAMVAAGMPVISMQAQYSLLDRRPETTLLPVMDKRGVSLFAYGTVAGGFLSDRWLGVPEPEAPLENRSLTKYKLIIDDLGGWPFLQRLLSALRTIADRHASDIATVASAAVLARPGVAAVIVGARSHAHLAANAAIADLTLGAQDRAELEAVLSAAQPLEGDVYALERDRRGRHGSIMKYNLNKGERP